MVNSKQLFFWLVRQTFLYQQTPLKEGMQFLQVKQQELGLSDPEADAIIQEALVPYLDKLQAYQAWCETQLQQQYQQYQRQYQQQLETQFQQAIIQYLITPQLPITEKVFKTLRDSQQTLGLTDDRAIQIIAAVLRQHDVEEREFEQVQRDLFQQAVIAFLIDRPMTVDGIRNLKINQQTLFLSEQQAREITHQTLLLRQLLLLRPGLWNKFEQLQQEEQQHRQHLYQKEQFRLLVEQYLIYQSICLQGLYILREKQQTFGLTDVEFEQIINEVLELEPAKQQDWQQVQKQEKFYQAVQEFLIDQPVTLIGISNLKGKQLQLGLTDIEANAIIQASLAQNPGKQQEYEQVIKQENFCQAAEGILSTQPLSIQTIAQVIDLLKSKQKEFDLTLSQVFQIIDQITIFNKHKYQQFRQLQQELFRQEVEYYINDQPISQIRLNFFKSKALDCLLNEQQANLVIQEVIKTKETNRKIKQRFQEEYQQRLQTYDQVFDEIIRHGSIPLSSKTWEELYEWRFRLGLQKSTDIPDPNRIRTAKRINYTQLWRFLKAQNWQAACEETLRTMLEATNRQEQGFLSLRAIQQFPCVDLCTIDSLWHESSNGKFGFSRQYKIWQETQQDQEEAQNHNLIAFATRVGWHHTKADCWFTYESLDFSLDAPDGHLPALPLVGWWCWMGGMKALFDRLETCLLQDGDRLSHNDILATFPPVPRSVAIDHNLANADLDQSVADRSAD